MRAFHRGEKKYLLLSILNNDPQKTMSIEKLTDELFHLLYKMGWNVEYDSFKLEIDKVRKLMFKYCKFGLIRYVNKCQRNSQVRFRQTARNKWILGELHKSFGYEIRGIDLNDL